MEPVGNESAASGVQGRDGATQPEAPVDCYVLFRSHTDGLALYGALKGAGVGARISPTPRAARAECGMSLPRVVRRRGAHPRGRAGVRRSHRGRGAPGRARSSPTGTATA